jgi:hypothetical protein
MNVFEFFRAISLSIIQCSGSPFCDEIKHAYQFLSSFSFPHGDELVFIRAISIVNKMK